MANGKYAGWITPEGLLRLEGWARDGLTDEQISKNIGINPATLYAWKNRFSEISDALKKGKEVVDREVENALLKRARGYEYTERKVEIDEQGRRKVSQTVKQVAPDTTAAIFWLKNRKPDRFRDRPSPDDQSAGRLDELIRGIKEAADD